jgi:dTDP-4-amino-4,6-dideoxy-D-galactose acyltransferase
LCVSRFLHGKFNCMILIERVNWDSDFFGYAVGKTTFENEKDLDLDTFRKEAKNYKLIYIYSKELIDCCEFWLADKKVVLCRGNISMESNTDIRNDVQPFNDKIHNLSQLIYLALQSGEYSRFNLDKNFTNNEFSKLYKAWIINSIKGELAFETLVAFTKDKIRGLITINRKSMDAAEIGLLAVNKDARGLGIGTNLIRRAIERAKEEGFTNIQVTTQLDNLAALNLYKKNNFVVNEVTYVYHYWNL